MSLEDRVKRQRIREIRENNKGAGVTCYRCHIRFGPNNYGAGDDHIVRVCNGIVQITPLNLEGREVCDVEIRVGCALKNNSVDLS